MNNQASSNVDPPVLHFPLCMLLFFSHMILNLLERCLLRAPYVLNEAETAFFFQKPTVFLVQADLLLLQALYHS